MPAPRSLFTLIVHRLASSLRWPIDNKETRMLNFIKLERRWVMRTRWLFAAATGLLALGATAQPVQGITDTEILLGSITDVSGPVASVGGPHRDGMTLAVEEINAAGGVHGRKIRVIIEDSGYDPKKAVLAAQKLLTQDKVFALIGTLGSAMVQATTPLSTERNVPVLFPMASTEATFLPLSPLKFGLLALGTDSMRVGAKYFYDQLGKRRFGIIYQDDETGQVNLRAAEEQLKVHGLTLIERTSHKRGETNFSAQVARLKAANVDAVLLGINPREAAAFAVEAQTQAWKVEMMLSNATVASVVTLAAGAADGMYGTSAFVGMSQDSSPPYDALLQRFKTRFGRDVTDGVNFGYVSMMLFAEGARNAGQNLTAASMAQGLEKVKNFKTVFDTAPMGYSVESHAPARTAYLFQVKGGRWKVIGGPSAY
jgi:branched-chain amino acid transport system substrate-binding protein